MLEILTKNYLTRGFWGDEAWTALISQLSIPEIIQVTGQDFHPPLYYLIVHLFIILFGVSEWIRLISTFFWLLTAVVVYWLAKEFGKHQTPLISVGWLLTSPILFIFAFEARTYTLLAFISALSSWMFWRAINTKQIKWWWLYLLVAVLGVYTHYYAWFILASHGLYWLVFDRRRLGRVFLTYSGLVLAQLPWVPVLLSQLQSVAGGYWIGAMNTRTHWEFFVRTTAGDYQTPFELVVAIIFVMMLVGSLASIRLKYQKIPKFYWFLWFWLAVPILLPTIISFYKPIFFYRYLVFSIVPIILISLWGLQLIKRQLKWLMVAGVLILFINIDLAIFGRYPHTVREELAQITAQTSTDNYQLMTVLPAFAEVAFYNHGRVPLWVSSQGLIQASGKSLLDRYAEKDLVKVGEIEKGSYWLIEPGPKSKFIVN